LPVRPSIVEMIGGSGIEYYVGTAAGVKEQIALIKAIGKTHGSKSFEFARTKEEEHDLWSARKEALWSMMALKRAEDDQ
jgi:D-lactate dehydrogenase (cytochrome)